MTRRRRPRGSPMSFFSFQDIVACTTGIMVLLTLLLTMELLKRKLDAAERTTQDEGLLEKVAQAERERDALAAAVKKDEERLAGISDDLSVTPTKVANLEEIIRLLENNIQVTTKKLAAAKGEHVKILAAVREAEKDVKEATEKIAKLEDLIKKLESTTPVTVLWGPRGGKKPLFVECSADECVVAEIPRDGPERDVPREIQRFTGAGCYAAFLAWAQQRDRNAEYFVLLMRPEAVDQWGTLFGNLRTRWRFDLGWDAWPKGRNLVSRP